MSTILAVDDSATMRRCLEITFEGTEFNLVTVANAGSALEKIKALQPDLVITDVALDAGDGYELCSTIKLASPQMPVLMLSSKQNPFDPARGSQADDHIDKPFDTQVMQDKARELIRAAPRSDTDVPGTAPGTGRQFPAERAPSPPAQPRPISMPERAPNSKIPAPRRKRPTPVMMTTPQTAQQKAATASAAARRTVPFAMPSPLKKTLPSDSGRGGMDRTMPMPGAAEQAASAAIARGAGAPPPPPRQPLTRTQETPRAPEVSPRAEITRPSKPMGDTLPGVPPPVGDESTELPAPTPESSVPAPLLARTQGAAVATLPAGTAADLRRKLEALDLTSDQIEGVLALSRDVVEQVVWEVVPTLAETLIKEEIRRLTSG